MQPDRLQESPVPNHVFTILCRGLSVDVQTNSLTLFGVIEAIRADQFPAVIPDFSIATLFTQNQGERGRTFTYKARLVDPDKNEVFAADAEFTLEKPRHRILTRVQLLPIEKSGCYSLEVLLRPKEQTDWGEPVAIYPIEITGASGTESELFDESPSSKPVTS